jgi:hypothetical protein
MDFAEIIGGIGTQFTLRKGNSKLPSFSGMPPLEDEDQIGENEFYLYVASLDQYIDEIILNGEGVETTVKIPPVDQYNLFFCLGGKVRLVDNLRNAIDNYDNNPKLAERLESLKFRDIDPENSSEEKYIYDIIVKSIDGLKKEDIVPITRKINSHPLIDDIDVPLSDIPDDLGIVLGLVKESDGNELPVNSDKKVVLPTTMTENIIPDITFDDEGNMYLGWTPTEFDSLFATVAQGQLANTAIQGAKLNGNTVTTIDKILQLNNIATNLDIDRLEEDIEDKLDNFTITNNKISERTIQASKLELKTITNEEISDNANILAAKITGINGVAVTGTRSGNTVNLRMPSGNYLKMAWGYVIQNQGVDMQGSYISFPQGFFSSSPSLQINLNPGTLYYASSGGIAYRLGEYRHTNLTSSGFNIETILVNFNPNNKNFATSTGSRTVIWFAIGY